MSLRIDMPAGRIGPGKIALLEAIAREGSISAAGRALGMGYRRAWDLVDEVNRALGAPAVAAAVGGRGGGGSDLTEAGRGLVRDYREMERTARQAAARLLAELARRSAG